MPLPRYTVPTACVLLICSSLLAGCDDERHNAEAAAAPIRQMIEEISSHKYVIKSGRCVCIGYGWKIDANGVPIGGTKDYPAGILDNEFAHIPWMHRRSECISHQGQKGNWSSCSLGTTEVVCGVLERPNLPKEVTHVSCHFHNGPLSGYWNEYNVTQVASGRFVAKFDRDGGVE